MIKIAKRSIPPAKLNASAATQELKDVFEQNPDLYSSADGKNDEDIKKFDFNGKIYRAVKDELKEDQFNKCCFCEAIFDANSFGDVEHFRPKAAYKRTDKDTLQYPGYYWLAYDWNNLLFCCQRCNQEFKKNEFPLTDEACRVKNHLSHNKIKDEKPLLINPCTEDPEKFICFNQEIPKPKPNLSELDKRRAEETIRITGIDRKELNIGRREYLSLLKTIETCCNSNVEVPETIRDIVSEGIELYKKAAKSDAKFASMIRSNFPNLPK